MKMIPGHKTSRSRQGNAWVRVPLVLAAAATAVALAGCGSSKPAYCTDRTNLQNSVKGLTSSGISGIRSQLTQIQSEDTATTVVKPGGHRTLFKKEDVHAYDFHQPAFLTTVIIRIGISDANHYEVMSGLDAKDLIALPGDIDLQDGMRVKIVNTESPYIQGHQDGQ